MGKINIIKLRCKRCKTVFFSYGGYFPRYIRCENRRCGRMVDIYKEQVQIKDDTPQKDLGVWI